MASCVLVPTAKLEGSSSDVVHWQHSPGNNAMPIPPNSPMTTPELSNLIDQRIDSLGERLFSHSLSQTFKHAGNRHDFQDGKHYLEAPSLSSKERLEPQLATIRERLTAHLGELPAPSEIMRERLRKETATYVDSLGYHKYQQILEEFTDKVLSGRVGWADVICVSMWEFFVLGEIDEWSSTALSALLASDERKKAKRASADSALSSEVTSVQEMVQQSRWSKSTVDTNSAETGLTEQESNEAGGSNEEWVDVDDVEQKDDGSQDEGGLETKDLDTESDGGVSLVGISFGESGQAA